MYVKSNVYVKLILASSIFLISGCGEQFSKKTNYLPEKYDEINCDGDIESVNSKPLYYNQKVENNKNTIISGWVALSAMDGVVFDKVQLVIKDSENNTIRYDTFLTKRDDVSKFFGKSLDSSGFNSFINYKDVKGALNLGLIGFKNGKAFLCKNIEKTIHLKLN